MAADENDNLRFGFLVLQEETWMGDKEKTSRLSHPRTIVRIRLFRLLAMKILCARPPSHFKPLRFTVLSKHAHNDAQTHPRQAIHWHHKQLSPSVVAALFYCSWQARTVQEHI